MEEILASIRRIISEDEPAEAAPAAEAPAPAPEPEPEPEPVAAAPEPEPEPEPVEEEPLELTQRYEEPAPEPVDIETIGDIEASAAPEPFPAFDPGRVLSGLHESAVETTLVPPANVPLFQANNPGDVAGIAQVFGQGRFVVRNRPSGKGTGK